MPYKDKEKQKEKNREYQKKHYQNNKEYYLNKSNDSKDRLKKEFELYKESLKCNVCGENHPATLDFHHENPLEKEIGISKAVASNWSWNRLKKEIDKCIILCSNCHRKLHYEEKIAGGR